MKLKITVEGKTYEVEVEVEESAPSASPAVGGATPRTTTSVAPPATPTPPAGTEKPTVPEEKVCRSPIVGTVVRVLASPGQQVSVDEQLLVLEAMKMETSITAPVAGAVKRILVAAGDSVQSGQILLELE